MNVNKTRTIGIALVFLAIIGLLATGCSSNPPPDERPIPGEFSPAEREKHRLLSLDGAHNFRDLGGYRTADGRTVKWGVLFRSDKLSELSDDDLEYLKRLKLRRIVDFRSKSERDAEPDRIPLHQSPIRVIENPISPVGLGSDPAVLKDKILSGDIEDLNVTEFFMKANRAFVTDNGREFGGWIRSLAEPDSLPSLFHCTAGKDRTGFGAAIVLLALGVPKEDVIRDYMLTNIYTKDQIRKKLIQIRIFSLFRTDPETVRPLLGVERGFIGAAFNTMEEKYGSIEDYLREELGINDKIRKKLRGALLEG